MNNPLLELKEVSYKNKNNFTLNKVNLQIKSGEKIALLGKSGAGKTTLISILNGTLKPKEGRVKLFNTCLLYTSPSPRDNLPSRMPSSA